MKKFYLGFFIIIVLLFTSNLNYIFAQTYATLPFVEHFDNDWVNSNGTRDIPSAFWSNSIFTGENSWSRNDDGLLRGAWTNLYGTYLPSGSTGTPHSARFHSYSSFDQGNLDLHLNFSSETGNKFLTFNYINTNGADSLEVLLSVDNGASFAKYIGLTIQPQWFKYNINLGAVSTATGIIRFRAYGDNAFTDIGLDEVIVSGPSALVANFNDDVNVIHVLPGIVNFHDISSGTPVSWSWDFNNDGIVDATTQNPTYSYSLPGTYNVKLIVSNGTTEDTLISKNAISVYSKLTVPFTEDFENTWINSSDIRDVPSFSWRNSPATGFNSWSRDDDGYARNAWSNLTGSYSASGANGTSHSARFHTTLTKNSGNLETNVDFSKAGGDKTLTFYYINSSGKDSLEVFLASSPGAPFIKICGQKISADWKLVTINLGNILYTNGILRFSAKGDFGNDDIGIDDISVSGVGLSTELKADFYSNITKGENTLTAHFNDISANTPTSWSWDFDNDGTIDATSQNPTYTFTKPGLYNVKLSVANASGSAVTIKNEYIKVTGFASLPFYENFDHTWISVDDSLDVPSLFWKNLPATGINSWSRNDQGLSRKAWWDNEGDFNVPGQNGTPNSARFHTFDASDGQKGILDLKIDFSKQPFDDTLSYSFNNLNGTDFLEIYLSQDNGLSFTKIGTNTTVTNWSHFNIILGDIFAKEGIIRFIATSDNWGTDIGIDEIRVNGACGDIIKSFTLPGQTGISAIDITKHTIVVNMPYTPSIASLVANYTLYAGATAKVSSVIQTSGTTINDFSSAITYNVVAADGITQQDWVITVNMDKNTQTGIVSFLIPGQTGVSVINSTNYTVNVDVPFETNVTSLVSTYGLSSGAIAKVGNTTQTSGISANDFTNAVPFTIIAEDGIAQQVWNVTVNISKSNKADFISYGVPDQIGTSVINSIDHTISAKIPSSRDLKSLINSFTLSDGANAMIGDIAQVSSITTNDFTKAISYIITAADGISKQTWVVTISQADAINLSLNESDVNAYPNPSSGFFNIKLSNVFNGKISVEVFDLKGIKVVSFDTEKNINNEPVIIDLNAYPAGLYNVIIKKADKVIHIKLNKI